MRGRRLKLKTQSDFVKRLSQASVMVALEELIWNAFDERARTVSVSFELNKLDGVVGIEIADDGQSLPHSRASDAFEQLGNSNKLSRRLESGERLHGQRGEGRHKAFSLGDKVVWCFRNKKSGVLHKYEIIGTAGRSR